MDFSWMSFDGYLQYAPYQGGDYLEWNDSLPKVYQDGNVINYGQCWVAAGFGFAVEIPIGRFFQVNLALNISPLVICAAKDTHLYENVLPKNPNVRNTQFNDYVSGGISLEPRAELTFSPIDLISISLYFSYKYLNGAKGESYSKLVTSTVFSESSTPAGAGFKAMDAGLAIRVHI
jgi:hypothetical protein